MFKNESGKEYYLFVKGEKVMVENEIYKAYVSASGKFSYEYKKAKNMI